MAQGKRAGARHKPQLRPALLLLALGITAAMVAWGYLVGAAINFGSRARGGESLAWGLLAMAALGAVMCLFLGLLLVARLGRALGQTRDPGPDERPRPPGSPLPLPPPPPPVEPGGRRAAR